MFRMLAVLALALAPNVAAVGVPTDAAVGTRSGTGRSNMDILFGPPRPSPAPPGPALGARQA